MKFIKQLPGRFPQTNLPNENLIFLDRNTCSKWWDTLLKKYHVRPWYFAPKSLQNAANAVSETHALQNKSGGACPWTLLQTWRHKQVTSLLTDINKYLDPPLKLRDFQSTTKIWKGIFQMFIYINIKLQPGTCGHSSVRRLTILFSFICTCIVYL